VRKNSLQGWVLGAATILLLSFRPAQAPPLWWDEGWALTIARNWVESGSYGPLRSGQLASANILTLGLRGVAWLDVHPHYAARQAPEIGYEHDDEGRKV
jgi:hypothetical protein